MWTALLLVIVVAGGTAAYGAWAFHEVAHGMPAWLFVVGYPFAYLAVPLFFATFWFMLAWWFRARRPADVRLAFAARIAMFAREVAALARSAPRMILYQWLVPDPPPSTAALPIVLLHGVGCNAGIWSGMREHLVDRGAHAVYALSYGPPLHSMEVFADQLAAKITAVVAATGARQVVVIAHSMGGLVARAYLRRYGSAAVRRLVMIGTPNEGSMHAWLMFGQSLTQLRPGNAWLAELNRDARSKAAPAVSIWSWHDSMVTPQTSSRIDWGENVVLTGIAHNALLDHPLVRDQVDAQIAAAATSGSPA